MTTRFLRCIVIGTSAGGTQALQVILRGLPTDFNIPIVVVQHLPPTFSSDVRYSFKSHTDRPLLEIEDKMPIEKGHVYFAPAAYHTLIESDFTLALSQDEEVCFSRPSIDVLFQSAATALGPKAIGVLLTGANADGADGLHAIHQAGGVTLVQNPLTADAQQMPKEALKRFSPNFVVELDQVAPTLCSIVEGVKVG